MASKVCSVSHNLFLLRRTIPFPPPLFISLSFSRNRIKCSPFSTTSTPYPLQYDMIISRPSQTALPTRGRCRFLPRPIKSVPEPSSEISFEDWVDHRLSETTGPDSAGGLLDKGKRKYYNKRRKRMYGGSDSDDERRKAYEKDELVELNPEVVELRTLHKREEELYFYDVFAYPWEKDKHYRMVYQLEKKYFPDQCLDKAFLDPGESNQGKDVERKARRRKKTGEEDDEAGVIKGNVGGEKGDRDEGLIFFDELSGGSEGKGMDAGRGGDDKEITEKRVEEFFKCLKKVPGKNGEVGQVSEVGEVEPFLASRSTGLPSRWDSAAGTVVLVNKPKGWTSFTVCGKLRRLVKEKKVGHAGTLDPMATGLLIVCVGKATKVVDRYQGMTKGYSGVFRLGEATSTWDADSPVIQREPWEHIKDKDIKKAAASFVGEIWQVPPMFSAIKVGGERMYEKARRGESIELSPRRISIFQFDIERSLEDRQNLIFRVTCSKGTYIRSLCADFGKALGSCTHLTALRRDSIGEYSADAAFEFKELEEEITKGYL